MACSVFRVAAGQAATNALAARVRAAKADDPLAPVTVVVASNYAGVSMRRYLAKPAGIIGVQFLTLYRLAELLGSARLSAQGRRPVSTPLVATAVRAVLTDDAGMFAPVADHPATEEAFVSLHKLLADVPADALDRLAAASERADDVVRIHRSIQVQLRGKWHDEADLFGAACDAIADTPDAPVITGLGTVIVHIPRRLTPSGAALLRTLGTQTDVVVACPTFGASVDDVAARIARQLAVSEPPPVQGAIAMVDQFVSASDADDEVRAALRIVTAAFVDGTPLERIALLYSARDPYARIVHEQLVAASITHNGLAVRPLAESIAGRLVLGLLALPDAGWRRDAVFEVLASGPVRHHRQLIPVTRWERISRSAGIVGGPEHWRDRLGRHITSLSRRADRWTDMEFAVQDATRLAAFIDELLERLADEGGRTWQSHAGRAAGLLRRLTGTDEDRAEWPDDERASADAVLGTIDRLATLGDVERGPIDGEVFRRTLELELESSLDRVGRFGEGVLTGDIGMAEGLDLDVVIIVGMNEGHFPSSPRDDSLLPDRDRSVVGDGLLPTLGERTDHQHRQFCSALAAAHPNRGYRVLTSSRGDLRGGGDLVPSRWLVAAAAARTGTPLFATSLANLRDEPWYDELPSFEGALLRTRFPSSATEYDLADLLHHAVAGGDVDTHRVASTPAFARGRELQTARHSGDFTRFDGNLAHVVEQYPVWQPDKALSPTSLERWAKCPHAYFIGKVLGVSTVENPEDLLDISPLDNGNLVHKVLQDAALAAIAAAAPVDATHAAAILETVAADFAAQGVTGKRLLWERSLRRLRREIDIFALKDAERLACFGGLPVAAEHEFGIDTPAVEHTLPDGRVILFKGSIDRVDRAADGRLVVTDYKTGGDRGYVDIGRSGADPIAGGQRLQLAIYALAARATLGDNAAPVTSSYWFVSHRGKWRERGYDVDGDALARFDEAVAAMVTGIESGVFPAIPEAPDSWKSLWPDCAYCDPDNLGTGERHREWLRIAGHPDLELLRTLATWEPNLFSGAPT